VCTHCFALDGYGIYLPVHNFVQDLLLYTLLVLLCVVAISYWYHILHVITILSNIRYTTICCTTPHYTIHNTISPHPLNLIEQSELLEAARALRRGGVVVVPALHIHDAICVVHRHAAAVDGGGAAVGVDRGGVTGIGVASAGRGAVSALVNVGVIVVAVVGSVVGAAGAVHCGVSSSSRGILLAHAARVFATHTTTSTDTSIGGGGVYLVAEGRYHRQLHTGPARLVLE